MGHPELLCKRRRANPSIGPGLTSRSNGPNPAVALFETGDPEVANAVSSAELVRLQKLSNAAKAKTLEVRRSCDGTFDKINGVLSKWVEEHSVQMSSWEVVYMSDLYAMQQLAAEHRQAKESIEEADRREGEAQNKLAEAMAEFERAQGADI
jgi:hypothetical protein